MASSAFLISMFVVLVIGLLTGHQLAFVLGGIGTVFGYIGWGGHNQQYLRDQSLGYDELLLFDRDPDVRFDGELLDGFRRGGWPL